MSINFEQFKTILAATNYEIFRDKAKKGTDYPYIVYSFISETSKQASSRPFKNMPLYQVSLFTKGTEKDFSPIKKEFAKAKVPISSISSIQGDENDETVTNFFVQVRLVENVE